MLNNWELKYTQIKLKLPRALRKGYLDNLLGVNLNPIQEVEAIRQVIVAKIQYQLKLSDHGFEEARKINQLIRKYVKKILHLRTWTSTAWIHHQNGYNISNLLTTTMITRTKSTTKMKISKDKITQHTGDALTPITNKRLIRLDLQNPTNKREEVMKRLEDQLGCQNNEKALVTSLKSRHKRIWLWTQRGLKPGEKLRYLQALSGMLPTKVNKKRGSTDMRKRLLKDAG